MFLLLGLFFACTAEEPAADPIARIEPDQPFYLFLSGRVGDYSITMQLTQFPDRYASGVGYDGLYSYDRIGAPIDLYGSRDSLGLIELLETDYEGNTTGTFKGKMDEQGLFTGNWVSGDEKRTLPFELKPGSGIALNIQFFSDSLILKNTGQDEIPSCYVRQSWLYPVIPDDEPLQTFLRDQIRRYMVGDSLASLFTSPEAAFQANKEGHFSDFNLEVGDMLAYMKESGEKSSWIGSFDWDKSMSVYFNSDSLLTLGFMDYAFTGGAHGNYGTEIVSFDLRAKKVIKTKDIFKPGFEEKVGKLLAEAVRKNYGLDPTQPLSEILFENEVLPTENFGLTGKGVLFIYNPYEIAAYVFGQIELFIPFSELQGWLK